MSSCLLIVNPSSGQEAAKEYSTGMAKKLQVFFDEVEVKETAKADDATLFTETALKEGKEAVFCMGGDGTVNEAINGFRENPHQTKFGFIPLGTVNDLARALHIPLDPQEAIDSLDMSSTAKIDVGRVNGKLFTSNLAVGSLPEAVEQVTAEEKSAYGQLAYFLKGAKSILNQTNYDFHIQTEKEELDVVSPLMICALTNSVGSFENFLPEADPEDGRLRLVIFSPFKATDSLKILPKLITGHIGNADQVSVKSIRKAIITPKTPVQPPTNVDGDKGPEFPLTIEVLPSFLEVYVPPKEQS